MHGKRMVFVLGAGASAPYGFPLGSELRHRILTDSLPGNSPLHHGDFEPFKKALAESGTESVDAFLESDSARNFDQIGKWAIAEKVLQHEQHSRLFMDACDDHWLSYLFNMLLQGRRSTREALQLPVSFVTFNYDRSLEYYMTTIFKTRFNADEKGIVDLFENIPVIHVHGDLGPLPWQPRRAVAWCRDYSPEVSELEVMKAATQIKVIHEATETSAEFDEARKLLRVADSIYLLGFGYHPTNMKRLRLPFDRCESDRDRIDQIVGTAFRLTPVEVTHYERRLYKGLHLGSPALRICEFLRHNDEFLRSVSELREINEQERPGNR
jgi:hypothetical protein